MTSTYLINRFPSIVLKGLSPFQVLFGEKPSYDHLRVFGCLCYASIVKARRDKFEAPATPCVLIGYPFGQKAYKLLNLKTHKMFTSRDVFHEQVLPFHALSFTNDSTFFPHSQPFKLNCSKDLLHPTTFLLEQHDVALPEQATTSVNSLPSKRSTREHKTPSYLFEYVYNSVLS